jgi:DNA polymerase III epsilon subunit-like protein
VTAIAFVDTETTGLDPQRHEVWEVAIILRRDDVDTEHLWQIRPPEGHLRHIAQPDALKINRYYERIAVPHGAEAADLLHPEGPHPLTVIGAATGIAEVLTGAVLVGSNPGFDAAFLRRFLGLGEPPWHYRPVDIATLAAGRKLGMVEMIRQVGGKGLPSDKVTFPFSSRDLSRWVGVEPPGDDVAHTALGDARWARDVFDAVTGGGR